MAHAINKVWESGECGKETLEWNPSIGEEGDQWKFPIFVTIIMQFFLIEFFFLLMHKNKNSIRWRILPFWYQSQMITKMVK